MADREWLRFRDYRCRARDRSGASVRADGFDCALDPGGETVQLAHDVGEESDWSFENVFDAEAHSLIEEELHLQEAELLVDELVDECDFGWGDWFELIEVVGNYRQGDVVVVDEAIEVGEGIEAVLQGV